MIDGLLIYEENKKAVVSYDATAFSAFVTIFSLYMTDLWNGCPKRAIVRVHTNNFP